MRVIVTGGTGLIGRRLVSSLVGDGHRVTVLSRRGKSAGGFEEGVTLEAWDGRSAEPLTSIVDGSDAVVHLAGESIAGGRWTAERKRRIRDSRVDSSRAVAAAIEASSARPEVLVQASAVGYYGSRGDELLTESSAPGEGFLAEVCELWEAASAGVEALGVRRPVVRTGVVLDTDGGALPQMVLPFKLFAGGPVGSGRQWLPWIHRDDEVGALRFVLERDGASGPYNLTAPEPLTNREFSRELGRVLSRPSLLPAPGFALRLAMGEMAELVLEGQRVVPQRLLDEGYAFRFPTAGAALEDLLRDQN